MDFLGSFNEFSFDFWTSKDSEPLPVLSSVPKSSSSLTSNFKVLVIPESSLVDSSEENLMTNRQSQCQQCHRFLVNAPSPEVGHQGVPGGTLFSPAPPSTLPLDL